MSNLKHQCPDFPFFGASYPDATCIDGYLWDLDSHENGCLTKGGDAPCPFCNYQAIIDDAEPEYREQVKANLEALHKKYGYA